MCSRFIKLELTKSALHSEKKQKHRMKTITKLKISQNKTKFLLLNMDNGQKFNTAY